MYTPGSPLGIFLTISCRQRSWYLRKADITQLVKGQIWDSNKVPHSELCSFHCILPSLSQCGSVEWQPPIPANNGLLTRSWSPKIALFLWKFDAPENRRSMIYFFPAVTCPLSLTSTRIKPCFPSFWLLSEWFFWTDSSSLPNTPSMSCLYL